MLIRSKINSLNNLTNLNKLASNILVAASFLALTFLTIKTFAPDVASNAETNTATSGSSAFSASISMEDHVDTDITPTSTQSTYTSSNTITYTNTCPYGLNIALSSSSEETSLIRSGTDDGIKTIPTIADTATTLEDNTWGYSLDNGATYKSIPPLSNPATVVDTTTQGAATNTLDLKLGVKLSSAIPSGSYTNDIIYTVSAKPQCVSYNLSWDLNGGIGASGVSYAASDVNYGSTINLQSYTPSRNGYDFAGWKSSATGNTFATDSGTIYINPTNAMEVTLTAQWTPVNYTISYTLNGGSATNPTSYNIETNTITLNNPTRTGYTFTGWSGTGLSGSANKSVTIPKGSTGDKSYTANWTPVSYTISYNLNGGSATNNTSYNIETNAFTLNNPTRNGYTFTGWSGTGLSGSANKSVTIPKGSTGNRSYTANWTPVTYTISYNLNGGSASNPTSYTIESNAITLNNPTRGGGYTFTGWSGTGLSGSANKTVTIPKGSTGNRSYTANWQAPNISSISTMQAMTSTICSATSVGTSKNLTDTRDNNVYTVKKLADGKCWMTQNLRLANKTITSEDSNLPSGQTWTVPDSMIQRFAWDTSWYNDNAVYIDSTYGGYYRYYAATAGWGAGITSGTSPSDICPKGWRLPTGGPSGEFQALYNKYSSNALMRGEPGFVLSGYVHYNKRANPNPAEQGNEGHYWSSTVQGSSDIRLRLYINNTSVEPNSGDSGIFGYSVRCVAK